jgi:apolipoprotein N-acyltransferase
MYGFKLRYVKKSVLLLAALIALILAWSDLSHAFFTLITACAVVLVMSLWLARNAWTQTREDDARSARVATKPRRERKSRAQARARRAEELHPEGKYSEVL